MIDPQTEGYRKHKGYIAEQQAAELLWPHKRARGLARGSARKLAEASTRLASEPTNTAGRVGTAGEIAVSGAVERACRTRGRWGGAGVI